MEPTTALDLLNRRPEYRAAHLLAFERDPLGLKSRDQHVLSVFEAYHEVLTAMEPDARKYGKGAR
jgi:hypothetical protein